MVKKNKIVPLNDNPGEKESKSSYKNTRNKEIQNKELNIIEYVLNLDIPNKKSREKIGDDIFFIPKIYEYDNIIDINYNLQQLKKICRHYNIKSTGNKEELKKQTYNYMFYSYKAVIIQKLFKSHITKKYIKYHGPGFFKRNDCTNDCDFCTLDELNKIPYNQFFSFKDEENFIYGFDINSLYNLYIKQNKQVENPFNKKLINNNVLRDLINYIKYSNLLDIDIDINYNELKEMTETKKLEMKILSLFQTMDSLGNYTNMSWFTSLNKYELIKFIRELHDIWNYRANLSRETKREICPPYGNPFRNMNLNILSSSITASIKRMAVNLIDELINRGINNDSKSLGCYYVLSGLTLVNHDAAEAMPWLYESVNYQNN